MKRLPQIVRRGPLDRWHTKTGAEFITVDDTLAPARYARAANPARCAFADLSALPRGGFKGWRVWSVLGQLGIACPSINNRATEQPDGALCLRLGDSEALLLSGLRAANMQPRALTGHEASEGFYPVPRRDTHAWLLLLGAAMPSLLAKICAVDLRPHKFAPLSIAQTRIAAVSAVIARRDAGAIPAFHLLVDTTSAEYVWSALHVAGQEYDGGPVGLDTVRQFSTAVVSA
jgi:sarcosine oxidase subunit gamma